MGVFQCISGQTDRRRAPRMMPMVPPLTQSTSASMRNWRRMLSFVAPSASRRAFGDGHEHDVHVPMPPDEADRGNRRDVNTWVAACCVARNSRWFRTMSRSPQGGSCAPAAAPLHVDPCLFSGTPSPPRRWCAGGRYQARNRVCSGIRICSSGFWNPCEPFSLRIPTISKGMPLTPSAADHRRVGPNSPANRA
jgi:hypothetical protein